MPNQTSSESLIKTDKTTIKRVPQRGNYDRELVYQILDEGLICHVGFAIDGQPFVIPTAYGRVEDKLYIHGSPASRMLRSLQSGLQVCITVTLLDGLVLARSAFHHSMNYRSVVIFGTAEIVEDSQQKLVALKAFTEHIVPQRWDEVRSPNPQEIQGTLVLALPINEASAKIRTGAPADDKEDYNLPVWAGEIPLEIVAKTPIPDPQLIPEISTPNYAIAYSRNG
jgi:uncharacterized protein